MSLLLLLLLLLLIFVFLFYNVKEAKYRNNNNNNASINTSARAAESQERPEGTKVFFRVGWNNNATTARLGSGRSSWNRRTDGQTDIPTDTPTDWAGEMVGSSGVPGHYSLCCVFPSRRSVQRVARVVPVDGDPDARWRDGNVVWRATRIYLVVIGNHRRRFETVRVVPNQGESDRVVPDTSKHK